MSCFPALRGLTGWLWRPLQRASYSSVSSTGSVGADRWYRPKDRTIVLIDGVRTPFMIAGTEFALADLNATELARRTFIELHDRTGVPLEEIQNIVLGNVVPDVGSNNVARDAALMAGYPPSIPAHSVNMACMSSILSITTSVAHMRSEPLDVCVAGGSDYLSDMPIRIPGQLRRAVVKSRRLKSSLAKIAHITRETFSGSLSPETPHPLEITTGEAMAATAQRLGHMMNVTRHEQDVYALRSHQMAVKAYDAGHITDVMPIKLGRSDVTISRDNTIRVTTLEKLSKLKPSFPPVNNLKPTMTAGNCTYLTDGASVSLLMTEERAKALRLKPKAYIRDFLYVAQNPNELPLSGGVFAIPALLERCRLTMDDIDVWEILEDFAAQVVANLKAMDSDQFAQKYMNRSSKVGMPPLEKINAWGGSLSMGHPFAATGGRMLMHAVNRLIVEDKQLALIMGCAMGGQGAAMIVERYPGS